MNNKFKIIIPVYNAENYIGRCLSSVQVQAYNDWEAIVVDDASTDRTFEIASGVAREDDRITVYKNSENKKAIANVVSTPEDRQKIAGGVVPLMQSVVKK